MHHDCEEGGEALPEGVHIASFTNSTMASHWTTRFFVAAAGATLRVTARCEELDQSEPPLEWVVTDIEDAAELHDALVVLRDETCETHNEFEWDEVADLIEGIAPTFAVALRDGEEALERIRMARAAQAEWEAQIRILPFRRRIDRYVLRFADEKLHYPGAGKVYPSRRYWVRSFLEDYVVEHGKLPTGTHHIEARRHGFGMSLGSHDFNDLGGGVDE